MRTINAIFHSLYFLVIGLLTLFSVYNLFAVRIGTSRRINPDGWWEEITAVGLLPVLYVVFKACLLSWKGFRRNAAFPSAWLRWGLAAIVAPILSSVVILGNYPDDRGLPTSGGDLLYAWPLVAGPFLLFMWLLIFAPYLFFTTRRTPAAHNTEVT